MAWRAGNRKSDQYIHAGRCLCVPRLSTFCIEDYGRCLIYPFFRPILLLNLANVLYATDVTEAIFQFSSFASSRRIVGSNCFRILCKLAPFEPYSNLVLSLHRRN